MSTAIDVMKYIRSRRRLYGEVHLQKLVYYVQAWSLAWDGRPLFRERVEAWRMGPVLPVLRFRGDGPDSDALLLDQQTTVDAVLSFYGKFTGQELTDRTHQEAPWKDIWGDRRADDTCSDEISHDSMRRFYSNLALSGAPVPRREAAPTSQYAPPSMDEVRSIASANADRWKGALALLAK